MTNHVDWKNIIKQQSTSGLSVPAFCKKHRLKTATFYYHRSKLSSHNTQPTFLPAIISDRITQPALILRAGKFSFELPSTVTENQILTILNALEKIVC